MCPGTVSDKKGKQSREEYTDGRLRLRDWSKPHCKIIVIRVAVPVVQERNQLVLELKSMEAVIHLVVNNSSSEDRYATTCRLRLYGAPQRQSRVSRLLFNPVFNGKITVARKWGLYLVANKTEDSCTKFHLPLSTTIEPNRQTFCRRRPRPPATTKHWQNKEPHLRTVWSGFHRTSRPTPRSGCAGLLVDSNISWRSPFSLTLHGC